MKCLETRRTPEGHRRRRYERDDGSRFTTIEVPLDEWDRLTQRKRAAGVQAQAQALLAQGWKPAAVAHEFRIAVTTARRWKKGLR